MKLFKCVSTISSTLLFSISAFGANYVIISDNNIDQYLNVKTKSLIGESQNDTFRLINTVELPNGLKKNKYIQYFHNVPLYNSILTSTETNGSQLDWYGEMVLGIQEDIKNYSPKISEKDVLDLAKKEAKVSLGLTQNDMVKLYVRINENKKAELIYLVSFYVDGDKPSRPYYMIDAQSGHIIHSWEGLTSRQATGFGGNTKVGNYTYGIDGFPFLEVSDDCAMTTQFVDTINMQNQTFGGSLFRFNCPTNNYKFTNGAYSPLNDAHYFANMVYKMYTDWYQFDPLKMKLRVRVHFGVNLRQAFWNGQEMTFGDGDASTFPYTALDVMGHEVSHGVTEKNSGLAYDGQSGAINEAFSDMAGEAVESYTRLGGKDNDWLGGAAITKNSEAMRYFDDPTKDHMSIANQSDYHNGVDPHFASGIYNKAYYLLAVKHNWGVRKAFETFLLANRTRWKQNATFNDAACGVANAAKDLGYEVQDIIASFKEVGVDAICPMDPTPSQPDDDIILTNGSRVLINTKAGEEYRYATVVPRLTTPPYLYDVLQISLSNAMGNASKNVGLYVRYENNGPLQKLEASKTFIDNNEVFSINKPNAGNYHILIKAKATDSVTLQAFYGNLGKSIKK